jgi:clan AA aspartic protease (TIGR02281 family)
MYPAREAPAMRTPTGWTLAAACALIWAAGAAAGEIYRWTDEQGQLHFTESLVQVPPQYRSAAKQRAEAAAPSRVQVYSGAAASPEVSRAERFERKIHIPFNREGSLMRVTVRINDQVSAPFYIDTGASGISLPSQIADQLGIRVRSDTPHIRVTTAAGVVARPVVTLDSVELGAARVEGLEATINPAMQIGLLGGTFFNNFVYQVDYAKSEIVLEPNQRIRGGLDEAAWRDRFRSLRDPIERIEAYLASDQNGAAADRARLERNRDELRSRLAELEQHANRLNVPHTWRQ